MIPLREHRTKKINIGGSGKIQKSFRAKDTGCETAPFSWIYSIQSSCQLHAPPFMLLQCLMPHGTRHHTTLLLTDNTRENKEYPPPSQAELTTEFGNFLPSKNTNIFLNSGMFVEIHIELLSLVKLYILTLQALSIFLNPGLN